MATISEIEVQRRHLVYVITEDWFFASHFKDRALAAISSGYQVTVITRSRESSKQLQGSGLSFINIEFARRGLNPIKEIHTILQLKRLFDNCDRTSFITLRSNQSCLVQLPHG